MPVRPVRVRVPLRMPQAVPATTAAVWRPARDADRPTIVLGHGAGTDMTNPILLAVADDLSASGYPVVLFNFGYVTAGRRAPDPAPRLEECFRDVLAVAAAETGQDDFVLGGRSMGGRIASHIVAAGQPSRALVFLGYPLHRPAKAGERPERLRTGHWERLTVPALFVQGARDRLCDLGLLESELGRYAGPTAVHVIADGDHGFAVPKRTGRAAGDVHGEVSAVVRHWLDEEVRQ